MRMKGRGREVMEIGVKKRQNGMAQTTKTPRLTKNRKTSTANTQHFFFHVHLKRTGVEKSVLVDDGCGGLWVVLISGHHLWPSDEDFACLPHAHLRRRKSSHLIFAANVLLREKHEREYKLDYYQVQEDSSSRVGGGRAVSQAIYGVVDM